MKMVLTGKSLWHILLTERSGFLCPQPLVRCNGVGGVGGGHLSPGLTGYLESPLGSTEQPGEVICILY